jgi:hypothetical protein
MTSSLFRYRDSRLMHASVTTFLRVQSCLNGEVPKVPISMPPAGMFKFLPPVLRRSTRGWGVPERKIEEEHVNDLQMIPHRRLTLLEPLKLADLPIQPSHLRGNSATRTNCVCKLSSDERDPQRTCDLVGKTFRTRPMFLLRLGTARWI